MCFEFEYLYWAQCEETRREAQAQQEALERVRRSQRAPELGREEMPALLMPSPRQPLEPAVPAH